MSREFGIPGGLLQSLGETEQHEGFACGTYVLGCQNSTLLLARLVLVAGPRVSRGSWTFSSEYDTLWRFSLPDDLYILDLEWHGCGFGGHSNWEAASQLRTCCLYTAHVLCSVLQCTCKEVSTLPCVFMSDHAARTLECNGKLLYYCAARELADVATRCKTRLSLILQI